MRELGIILFIFALNHSIQAQTQKQGKIFLFFFKHRKVKILICVVSHNKVYGFGLCVFISLLLKMNFEFSRLYCVFCVMK